jgi:histidine triad (HIT) family protein
MTTNPNCVFCRIVKGTEPATVRYEDDDVIVFDNVLNWTPVMMLAVPKTHRTQSELWSDLGPVGRAAAALGRERAPDGFRLVSNFGALAMQSQSHGHIHILDRTEGQLEVADQRDRSIVDIVSEGGKHELSRTDHAVFYDARPFIPEAPVTVLSVPTGVERVQLEFWEDMRSFGADVVDAGWEFSDKGFRLLSNFPGEVTLPGGEKAHVHVLGGTFLGEYA